MDKQDLKKLLAGLTVASLITGAGLTMGGCAATSSSGEKQSSTTMPAEEKPAAQQPTGGSG